MIVTASDAGLLFVDVGMKGASGNMRFVPSKNDDARIKEFLSTELPSLWRKKLEAAGKNGISGSVNNLNVSIKKPTFIVFNTVNKNWAFDKSVPIDMESSKYNSAGHCQLIQISGCNNCFILYNCCEGASLSKYSLFVDVKSGRGANANITKLIIDPDMGTDGGNEGP